MSGPTSRRGAAGDPYAVLEVAADASDDELKRAYRRLARQWHPDRNPAPDAADRFKEVAAAWELVSDPVRRRAFDLRARRTSSAGGGLDEDFLEHVASAIERAQDWIESNVLPHYAGSWRGRGSEMATRLWLDLERLLPPRTLPVTSRGRRLARPWIRDVHVALDDRPSSTFSILVPGRRQQQIVIYASALWSQGFREPVAIDDAVLRVLLARYAQVVARGRLPPVDGDDEQRLAEARRIDDLDLRSRNLRLGVWGAVAALAAFMLLAGYFQW